MNKDLLVAIGAIIAPVILVLASLTYVSKPAILGQDTNSIATAVAANDIASGHEQVSSLNPRSVK